MNPTNNVITQTNIMDIDDELMNFDPDEFNAMDANDILSTNNESPRSITIQFESLERPKLRRQIARIWN